MTSKAIPVGPEGGVQLPKDRRGGDLFALMDDKRQCNLWFCVHGEDDAPAKWAQVLLGNEVAGTV